MATPSRARAVPHSPTLMNPAGTLCASPALSCCGHKVAGQADCPPRGWEVKDQPDPRLSASHASAASVLCHVGLLRRVNTPKEQGTWICPVGSSSLPKICWDLVPEGSGGAQPTSSLIQLCRRRSNCCLSLWACQRISKVPVVSKSRSSAWCRC